MKSFLSLTALVLGVLTTPIASSYLEDWDIALTNSEYQAEVDANITACASMAMNHGDFVSCVTSDIKVWKADAMVTKSEASAIKKSAAKSDVGKTVAEIISEDSGVTLPNSTATAFDDCLLTSFSWGQFNSCANKAANKLRKSLSKSDFKALKMSIKDYKSTFMTMNGGDNSTNTTSVATKPPKKNKGNKGGKRKKGGKGKKSGGKGKSKGHGKRD